MADKPFKCVKDFRDTKRGISGHVGETVYADPGFVKELVPRYLKPMGKAAAAAEDTEGALPSLSQAKRMSKEALFNLCVDRGQSPKDEMIKSELLALLGYDVD